MVKVFQHCPKTMTAEGGRDNLRAASLLLSVLEGRSAYLKVGALQYLTYEDRDHEGNDYSKIGCGKEGW